MTVVGSFQEKRRLKRDQPGFSCATGNLANHEAMFFNLLRDVNSFDSDWVQNEPGCQ